MKYREAAAPKGYGPLVVDVPELRARFEEYIKGNTTVEQHFPEYKLVGRGVWFRQRLTKEFRKELSQYGRIEAASHDNTEKHEFPLWFQVVQW